MHIGLWLPYQILLATISLLLQLQEGCVEPVLDVPLGLVPIYFSPAVSSAQTRPQEMTSNTLVWQPPDTHNPLDYRG